MTVKNQKYYVYRYEGKLNGIENAVVLLNYPEKAFGIPKALRAFLSTDVSLSTDEIISYYVCRWPIEIFFRQCKDKLALDSYQMALAEQVETLDKTRLGERIGEVLDDVVMEQITVALQIQIGAYAEYN